MTAILHPDGARKTLHRSTRGPKKQPRSSKR
jgi:hypothetical protein